MAHETTGFKDDSWIQTINGTFSHSVASGPMGDESFPVPKEKGVPGPLSFPPATHPDHILASGHTGTDPTHLPS